MLKRVGVSSDFSVLLKTSPGGVWVSDITVGGTREKEKIR
jgi:hypothetical protein